MKMRVTITADLEDNVWGFSKLISSLGNHATEQEKIESITALVKELEAEVLEEAKWLVEVDPLDVCCREDAD